MVFYSEFICFKNIGSDTFWLPLCRQRYFCTEIVKALFHMFESYNYTNTSVSTIKLRVQMGFRRKSFDLC